MHIHAYTCRFTPPTSGIKGRFRHPAGGEDFRNAPFPPEVTRDWLLRSARRVADTFDSAESALAWFQRWISDNPRPDSSWLRWTPAPEGDSPTHRLYQRYEQRLTGHAPVGASWPPSGPQHKIAYTSNELAGGRDVVDGFYTADQYVGAYLIFCPAPGYVCPLAL